MSRAAIIDKLEGLPDELLPKVEAYLDMLYMQQLEASTLTESQFWGFIDLLDWDKEEDSEIIAPLIGALSELSLGLVESFASLLAQKLYQLDGWKYAKYVYQSREEVSADDFLAVRCCVVANGKEAYEDILSNPEKMPTDLSFEALLQVIPEVYKMHIGWQNFIPVVSHNFETFSNSEGWEGIASN